jgi:hypothetical protein
LVVKLQPFRVITEVDLPLIQWALAVGLLRLAQEVLQQQQVGLVQPILFQVLQQGSFPAAFII